ncbi:Na/Pi symporter [Bacillus swezeyi]|uniref:Na/Pi cotransporter family protein n=1 Tax=Bacillus swezeyi TaxID=1925020 RepID=A0A5M8RU28_9BACI|nr:Na/Pi symporter [Bacillus swezeyi]KAA6452147.1 Na/Pi cotransporter family protein [Bacillus swezeyi]KAA6482687.1 Na/Pi cotransporter family protein [Bacillus swezeyi]TYS36303.1 Na/Pi cotransporter family protein [Bacillus swezeyi]
MMIFILFVLLIVLFLAGMSMLRKGLISLTFEKIEKRLLFFTDHPLKAFLVSIVFTGILQSSSAFMVIVIGFVSIGALSFKRSIPLILGTNIGSTFTTEFLAVKLEFLIFALFALGAVLVITRKSPFQHVGVSLIGLGVIFFCISGFSRLAVPLSQLDSGAYIVHLVEHSPLYALIIGMVLTAIIHSSSACVGILMSFMDQGVVGLTEAMSVVLGSNIGTCITAVMAAVKGGAAAKQTAYAHVLFNIIGVAAVYPALSSLTGVISGLSASPAQQIAHFSLLFNIVTSILFLPLTNIFHSFIMFLFPNQNQAR